MQGSLSSLVTTKEGSSSGAVMKGYDVLKVNMGKIDVGLDVPLAKKVVAAKRGELVHIGVDLVVSSDTHIRRQNEDNHGVIGDAWVMMNSKPTVESLVVCSSLEKFKNVKSGHILSLKFAGNQHSHDSNISRLPEVYHGVSERNKELGIVRVHGVKEGLGLESSPFLSPTSEQLQTLNASSMGGLSSSPKNNKDGVFKQKKSIKAILP